MGTESTERLRSWGQVSTGRDGFSTLWSRVTIRATNRICKCAAESVSVEPAKALTRLSPSRTPTVP
jgi:hypothetical protein